MGKEQSSSRPSSFIALYARVLRMLGSDGKLGAILAIANVMLAMAMFAEPILFGLVIDTLATPSRSGLRWRRCC